VVTGSSGFIGSQLVRALLLRHERVVIVVRAGTKSSEFPKGDVIVIPDPGDAAELGQSLSAHGATQVIHLATHFLARHTAQDIAPLIESNISFGTRLVEAATAAGVSRFVTASSSWQHLRGERYAPVSLYAATKQAFEDILRYYSDNAGMSVRILTLFDSYGPGDTRRKLLPLLLRALGTGEQVALSSGRQFIDLLHVDDVVAAFLHAVSDDCPDGTFTVSSGQIVRVYQLVQLLGDLAGRSLNVVLGAVPDRPNEMVEPWEIGLTLPGWAPRISLREGLSLLISPQEDCSTMEKS